MLLRMLKSLTRAAPEAAPGEDESPHALAKRLARAHAAAPMGLHTQIAFGAMTIGERNLIDLVNECLVESGSAVAVRKALHRPIASYFLARYYLYSLDLEGDRAECGVFAGTSALVACRAARTRDPSYTGAGLHLIDSFEGLADPTEEDRFDGYTARDAPSYVRGAYGAPLEHVRTKTFADFPDVAFHKGWIPAVFETLPERAWSFVHLDVDHYAPTHAGLEYFWPRLTPGGVIICDDYGSPTFPGAQRAWHAWCDEHEVPFVVHDTGQAVILKAADLTKGRAGG